jgi:hypothetical protein
MSIIYSYPIKGAAVDDDLILISDSASTPKFATKQVRVSGLPFSNNQGTVTSVGVSMPSAFAVAGSPITSSGNIAVTTTGGSVGQFLAHDGTWGTPTGGAANPAGDPSQIQYNLDGSSFGASPDFSYASSILRVKHTINVLGQGNLLPAGRIKLHCENSSHGVTLEGPAHAGNNSYLLKFPSAAPTDNQILEYTTAGSLGWIATPSGAGGSYAAGDGLQLNATTFSTDLKSNGGLVIETTSLALDLSATSIAGTLAISDGGTGSSNTEYCDLSANVTGILPVGKGGTGLNTVGTTSGYVLTSNGSSAASWAVSTNISNTDLSFSANRTLDIGNKSLTIIDTGSGSTKNLFKFVAANATDPTFTVGHTTSAEGYIVIEGNGSNRTGQVQFKNAVGDHYTGIKATPTQAATINYTLPATQGALGQFLKNDGTGVLSWDQGASYTEGTWTPSLTFGGGEATPTLAVASGNYVIIGKYVYANFYVVVQAGQQYTGTSPRISIPVTAASHSGGHLMMNNSYTTASTNTSVILGSVVGGMSIVGLKTMDVSGSEVRIQNLAASPSTSYNNAVLAGSIIYLKS